MLTTQRHDRRVRRQAGLLLESLDDRLLLSGGAPGATAEAVCMINRPATRNRDHHISPREVLRGRIARCAVGQLSRSTPVALPRVRGPRRRQPVITSPPVKGLSISRLQSRRANQGGVPPRLGRAYLSDLRADGLQVIRTVPAYGLAEGTLPIAKLPAITPLAAHVWPDYEVNPSRHASK